MAYARELKGLRKEMRQGVATTFEFWPKINGANVLASSTGGDCTWQVFDTGGTSIEGPTNVTPTTVDDISRLDIPAAAISTLDENYWIVVLWKENGSSFQRSDVIYFDVVLYPYGNPSVSLNDLYEERPGVDEILDRLGQRLGYTAGDTAKETMAAIYAERALVELDSLIRNQINLDAISAIESFPNRNSGRTRPNLILNRERLNRVERKLALREIYRADMTGDDDESTVLFEHYKEAAAQAWASIGPLTYDTNEDLYPDSIKDDIGRVVVQRRVQG